MPKKEETKGSKPTKRKVRFERDFEKIDEEELRKLYQESFGEIREGNLIKGKVVSIDKDGVLVDIGFKSEGIISIEEFGEDIGNYKPGDEIDVLLEATEDSEGMVVLSKLKADKQRRWDQTILKSKEGDMVTGKVVRKVKGGLIVDIGMDAFLPASQIDIKHITNIDQYLNQTYEFKIIKINSERKNIVLSRRELLEEERAKNREKLLKEIDVGQIREGIVKNITAFGAFIDLYGLDGLLHITDMTWGRISHPSEMLSIGDKVEVIILDYDREKQRISLGLKQKTPNPWEDIESKYPVGSIVKGRIVSLAPYGAFVEVEKGIEGLIHVSEMSWTKRITDPSEVLSIGDIVEAMVLSIKKDEQKISLGIKQTEFNPWSVAEEKYPPGTKVKGKVRNLTTYGAFIELEEGIDGLIHISDISWTRKINHPGEVLKKGDDVDCIVLAVNQEEKKITLGLKQLQKNPWETIEQVMKVGSVVEGIVSKITDFGVFVILPNDIECLIHKTQLSDKAVEKVENVVKLGDKIEAKVIKIEPEERKISLSVKEYLQDLKMRESEEEVPEVKPEEIPKEELPSGMGEKIEEALQPGSAETGPEKTEEPSSDSDEIRKSLPEDVKGGTESGEKSGADEHPPE